jgi:hypothetical protein
MLSLRSILLGADGRFAGACGNTRRILRLKLIMMTAFPRFIFKSSHNQLI